MIDAKKMTAKIITQLKNLAEKASSKDISNHFVLWNGAFSVVHKYVILKGTTVYYDIELYIPGSFVANTKYSPFKIDSAYRPKNAPSGVGYSTDSSYNPIALVSCNISTGGMMDIRIANTSGRYFFLSGQYEILGGVASKVRICNAFRRFRRAVVAC